MGGRGRGRGRGRAPPSGARLLLQRSAQEAGLDAGNLRSLQDITRPKLFPDYEWHSSGRMGHEAVPEGAPLPGAQSAAAAKRSAAAKNVYLINKSRELSHRFQNSAYYVRPTQEVDVVRYGKRPRPVEPDIHVLEQMGTSADSRYMPEELIQKKVPVILSMKELAGDAPKKAVTIEELATQELERRRQAAGEAEDEEEGELSDTPEQEEEEEEVADYTTNYYASDDESGGGGDGGDEATF